MSVVQRQLPIKHPTVVLNEEMDVKCLLKDVMMAIKLMVMTVQVVVLKKLGLVELNTGWAMIALTVSMIFVNFVVIITNVVKNKLEKTGENTQNVFDETDCQNNVTTYRNSAVTTSRHEIMHRNSRRLEE